MGMRVEAVWVPDESEPTLESIKYFRPTGEPDADRSTATRSNAMMRDVAIVAFAPVEARARPRRIATRSR